MKAVCAPQVICQTNPALHKADATVSVTAESNPDTCTDITYHQQSESLINPHLLGLAGQQRIFSLSDGGQGFYITYSDKKSCTRHGVGAP